MKKLSLALCVLTMLAGCSYLDSALSQLHYGVRQGISPTQRVSKHLLERDNFFLFGKLRSNTNLNEDAVAVIALSDQFQNGEVVDVSHFSRLESYYGLNLPAGDYRIMVVSDLNRDGHYDQSEVKGGIHVSLNSELFPEKVLGDLDIEVIDSFAPALGTSFRIPVKKTGAPRESLFYPKGTIRSLDDEIFSPRLASLGLYEPAIFMEEAPMMFYALEEDSAYKVPVVFIHGIGGSVRDFQPILSRLDRSRYRPWFFYYPSGYDLGQLSQMFYSIFLSGRVINLEEMPLVIVAHSMGGVVARDALNRMEGGQKENQVRLLITLASPLGGHPGAAAGSRAPVVIPSWRCMNPESEFMHRLWRSRLPSGLQYHLFYAYANPSPVSVGENSDGVVPLSSQLCQPAQNEARAQYGFNDSHDGILKNPAAVDKVIGLIEKVRSPFPEDHLKLLVKGGYQGELPEGFSAMEAFLIRTIGYYMQGMDTGAISPVHPIQQHFLQACRGEVAPQNDAESAWIKFKSAVRHGDQAW
jgi:pimeloyl-ACP methyl ester carboxylesterase